MIEPRTLPLVPGYDEVVDRNDISTLKVIGDLVLRNGDIALSRRGDLLLNDDDYHAFFALVQAWRFNLPTIKVLFEAVFEAEDQKQAAERRLEASFPVPTAASPNPLFAVDHGALHRANDHAGAAEVACSTYAGTIMIFLSKALQAFKSDIGASEAEWNSAANQWAGCSLGQIVVASANNVRHNDEWAITRPPTKIQLTSIKVLAAVLGEPISSGHYKLTGEVSPETLQVISGGSFDGLERSIFKFAKALLAMRQKRRPAA